MTSAPAASATARSAPARLRFPERGSGPGPETAVRAAVAGARVSPVVTPGPREGTVTVTFLAREPDSDVEVMLHLNGVTDAHREDVAPAILEPVPGSDVRHLSYVLPADLQGSYRYVHDHAIPRDAGLTRAGWLRIHERGRLDPGNPHVMPRPMGVPSSVLTLPDARVHPAWEAAAPSGTATPAGLTRTSLADGDLARARTLWFYRPPAGRSRTLLVLLDGDTWAALDVAAALDRMGERASSAVLVSSVDQETRSRQLPVPDVAGALLAEHVLPAAREHLGEVFAPQDVVISGQSYGGLAAAGVVATRPDVARTAIVQSGSFHFVEGAQAARPGDEPGTLVHRVRGLGDDALTGSRFVVQAGSEEGTMSALGQAFTAAARDRGGDATFTEYRGGHDYAWWRHGLLHALDELG